MKASFRRQSLNDEEDSYWVGGGCLERGKGEGRVVRAESTKVNRDARQGSNQIYSSSKC